MHPLASLLGKQIPRDISEPEIERLAGSDVRFIRPDVVHANAVRPRVDVFVDATGRIRRIDTRQG